MPSIAVDVMSGDSGAPECIPGALLALAADPALELILVGLPETIEPALASAAADVRARASVHAAASVVGMSEHPREARRESVPAHRCRHSSHRRRWTPCLRRAAGTLVHRERGPTA